jgi:hypothetical protein
VVGGEVDAEAHARAGTVTGQIVLRNQCLAVPGRGYRGSGNPGRTSVSS